MSVKPQDIIRIAQQSAGITPGEEVCVFGDCASEKKHALVCWMATPEAIQHAAEIGADLIICHEALFFPYETELHGGHADFLSWPANVVRAKLLTQHGLSCLRLHGSADALTIYGAFAESLGLTERLTQGEGWEQFDGIYRVGPLTYGELIERVRASELPILRYTSGDMSRKIERVGLPWGGMSLSVNISYLQKLIELGAQVFIAGESDSYGFHFAKDSGLYMIETGHEASENPGLRKFAEWLRERFPELKVSYYETAAAYTIGGLSF